MSKEFDDLIIKLGSWDDKDEKQLDLFDLSGQAAQPALTISAVSDTIDLSGLSYDISSSMASGTSINNGYTITTGSGSGQYTFQQPQPNITISNGAGVYGAGVYGAGYGQVLTTGTNGLNWSDIPSPGLKVQGDAEFEGDIKVKGKSITEMFDKIEERLAILHPNPELEERWEELKELGERYRELEKDILEKEKIWNILKR
jgi:hypothetical protein